MEHISRSKILELSTEQPVGLIYSRADLNQYLVELITFKRADYIHEGQDLASFSTVDEAVRSARESGATCFFLCLDNTYDECGSLPTEERFNYLPIAPSAEPSTGM
ncbi:hypothetical protein ACQUW5_02565 [Legionella sp. CNM-1927-20]|uniref:hypothetical protein n=1 Tax=Legionella sp. CNM-1927-20 TaxID=3422221 RepID=UPI00403AD042